MLSQDLWQVIYDKQDSSALAHLQTLHDFF